MPQSSGKRIAVLAHLKFPIAEPFRGGLEMHTHLLCEQLLQRGHRVTLFARAESDARFTVIEPELEAVTPGLGIDLFEEEPGFNGHFVNRLHAYQQVMAEVRAGGFDLVHNNTLHFLPLSLADTAGCPVVTVLHTPPFPSLQSAAMLARRHDNHRFISVSRSLGRQWEPFIGDDYAVVHNGLPDRWAFTETAPPNTAVWCGRICREKAPHLAIAAARRAGFALTLAGDVYDRDYFDRDILPQLGGDIRYAGLLNHRELGAVIGRSAVGLFTSVWDEPFGLVLPEMMACGTPVAGFASGAADEIVDARSGVLVDKGDVAALADALPRAAALRRTDCRRRARRDFGVAKMVDGYEHQYRRMLEHRDRRAPVVRTLRPGRTAVVTAAPAGAAAVVVPVPASRTAAGVA